MSGKSLRSIMKDYFQEAPERRPELQFLNEIHHASELPVSVVSSEWTVEQSPERLSKTYEFSDTQSRNYFLAEMLEYEKQNSHHAKICVEGNSISFEVYTHDLMRVTEVDKEYADYCDLVFSDVQHWS